MGILSPRFGQAALQGEYAGVVQRAESLGAVREGDLLALAQAHLGVMGRDERGIPSGIDGARWLEVILDGPTLFAPVQRALGEGRKPHQARMTDLWRGSECFGGLLGGEAYYRQTDSPMSNRV